MTEKVKTAVEAFFVNDKRLSHVPSPNKYTIEVKDKRRQPNWSMSMDARFKNRGPGGPGPGNYEAQTFVADGPKFTTRIKPKIDPQKCRTKTGPADY